MSARIEATQDRLDRLRARGGAEYDPLGQALIVTLVARAEAEDEAVQTILMGRIDARLDSLEAAFRADRARADGEIATLESAGIEPSGEVREALKRGDFASVRRGARRLHGARKEAQKTARVPWIARLRGEARSRDLALSDEVTRGLDALAIAIEDDLVDRAGMRRAQALGNAMSSALFRESAAGARAELAVARAADNLPDGAGPYNGQVLAAKALSAMAALSPGYVRALIAGLDDLAAMEALLAPEERKAVKPAKAKKPKKKLGGAASA
ncbi:MAG: DUF2894 domain-containing protein [Byssovorax sp.]